MVKKENKNTAEKEEKIHSSGSDNEEVPKEEKVAAGAEENKEGLEDSGAEVGVLKKKIDSLEKELAEKDRIIEDYFKQILRLTAEFENYRKRSEREKEEKFLQGKLETIKSIISLVDVFENAAKMIDNNRTSNENDPVVEGFSLLYREFINLLSKEGVKEINPINCKFDFWYHEVVESVERDDVEEDTVVEVMQKGYLYKDKVIRPAKVKIAKKGKKEVMH